MTTLDLTSSDEFCLISCGMLHAEITHLINTGFMKPIHVYFTPPGLHALPDRLEQRLLNRLLKARAACPGRKVVVVYGKKCYVHTDHPQRRVDNILQDVGRDVVRVQGAYGYDMLASYEDRQQISDGRQDKILWFTPGWLRSWKTVYQRYLGWDRADANANFPGFYDKLIVLDGLGMEEGYISERAEDVLELFDWTGLEVEFQPITLDRFKGLLREAAAITVEEKYAR
jgi:hypothetical protein